MSHVNLTTKIVCAWLSKNYIQSSEIPQVIRIVSDSLKGAAQVIRAADSKPGRVPAVPIDKSVTDEWIFCLEDGLKFKTLKKHLWYKYDLSPDEYRLRWGLPSSYPMVAPAYSRKRSELVQNPRHGRTTDIKNNQRSTHRS